LVPFQNFQTHDGWIVVACAKEKFWQRLVGAIGRPELAEDPRFDSFAARSKNRDALIQVLIEIFREQPTDHWLSLLTAAGVPTSRINTVEQALAEPQTAARPMLVQTEHPHWGRVRAPASPVRVGNPRLDHRRGPRRNEDADAILGDLLGYDEAQRLELQASGAFGRD